MDGPDRGSVIGSQLAECRPLKPFGSGSAPRRATSRLTVEAARSRRLAISRIDEPEAIPREMSSRSASVSASRERRRAAGGMPPGGNHTERMQLCGLSKARPISCGDCPAFHRLQTSRFSIAERPNRCPGLIQHHLYTADLHQMVLHRPIECTAFTRH